MSRSRLTVQNYFDKMKIVQTVLLSFIENDDNVEESYQNLINIFKNQKIARDYNLLKSTLYILKYIINNHHRNADFIPKISKILLYFKDEIEQTFSNYEIFNIFKNNKLILLFLLEEKIIVPDKSISFYISTEKYKKRLYPQYFFPEFKELFNAKLVKEIEPEIKKFDPEEFQQKRKKGENDEYICQLIRNDSIDEFIQYLENNKKSFQFVSNIKPSIFETNSLLMKNSTSQIEYAAFYGSLKIFNYLKAKRNYLNPGVWIYSIHSLNDELLNSLKNEKLQNDTYNSCLVESIKCHHNEIFNFFKANFDQKSKVDLLSEGMKHYNFIRFLTYKSPESHNVYRLMEYDYLILVENYLNCQGRVRLFSDDV